MPQRSVDADVGLQAALTLAADQAGLITRSQAIQSGMSIDAVKWQLTSRRWRQVFDGRGSRHSVYATFSGPLNTSARMWAAVLVCGRGATLSHETAGELHGLIDPRGQQSLTHVTVPSGRHVRPADGIRLHYSGRLATSRHPVLEPPRTRVEDTVVDLAQEAKSLDHAAAIIADAVQRRLTTHARIAANISERKRVKWRDELLEMCGVVGDGAQSLIEVRYVNGVERAHGLPKAERQVRLKGPSKPGLLVHGSIAYRVVDNRYDGVVVELDGQRGHTGDGVFRDMWRDNATTIQGEQTLRFGFDDVSLRPCDTAAIVAVVVDVVPILCNPACRVLEVVHALQAG